MISEGEGAKGLHQDMNRAHQSRREGILENNVTACEIPVLMLGHLCRCMDPEALQEDLVCDWHGNYRQ